MIALKQLCLIASSCPRNGQISNLSDRRFQIARVMSIAVIATLFIAFIGLGSNHGGHFFLQDTHQCQANGVLEALFHQRFKTDLTFGLLLRIVLLLSHGILLFCFSTDLNDQLGYQTPFLHNYQDTTEHIYQLLKVQKWKRH